VAIATEVITCRLSAQPCLALLALHSRHLVSNTVTVVAVPRSFNAVMCVLFGNGVGQDHAVAGVHWAGLAGPNCTFRKGCTHSPILPCSIIRVASAAPFVCVQRAPIRFQRQAKRHTAIWIFASGCFAPAVLSLHCPPMCLSVPRSLTHFVNPLLWQAGNYSDAVSSLLELQKQDPSDAKIKHNLAVAQMCVAPRSRSCLAPVGLVWHRAFPHACRLVGLVSHRALHHA
jgi:hypothetical protein